MFESKYLHLLDLFSAFRGLRGDFVFEFFNPLYVRKTFSRRRGFFGVTHGIKGADCVATAQTVLPVRDVAYVCSWQHRDQTALWHSGESKKKRSRRLICN